MVDGWEDAVGYPPPPFTLILILQHRDRQRAWMIDYTAWVLIGPCVIVVTDRGVCLEGGGLLVIVAVLNVSFHSAVQAELQFR